MRWTWLDLILELERETRCVAIRNVTWAEDVLADHFDRDPEAGLKADPSMPNSLVIEGMAQCAGILVGHAGDFEEKVILAKIGKASFTGLAARPGYTLRHTATLDRIDATGASTTGRVELLDPKTGEALHYADINLMFSHIDQNRKGLAFPEHNFVFTQDFADLLDRSGFPMKNPPAGSPA
ncbi:MAG: beta-hydroxyacyl-ACP dehydratase [Planctomycetota bacterium]